MLSIAIAITMIGCYPGGPEYTSDYSLVITDYDTEFDFGSKSTYYMPDTISFSTNNDKITEADIVIIEKTVIDRIELNMQNRGYERVDTTFTGVPDLFIGAAALAIENSGVGWVPGWGYPGWGWGWGGWYYPPYYPVGYSYSTGTVLILMGDPSQDGIIEDGEIKLPVAWNAGLDGLLSSYRSNNVEGLKLLIDQAFEQSQYIKSN